MPAESTPFERVAAYFRGELLESSRSALQMYFAKGYAFTGSAFDEFAAETSANRFTAEDIVAVSMLSVNVPARASLWLLKVETANELLGEIPVDASLWEQPDLLDRDGSAWRLWEAVDAQVGVGAVITSKLLAAKRPHLIPVYDQHVERALNLGASQWGFWQQLARDPRAGQLVEDVRTVAREAGVPEKVSLLRIIDVAVWKIASNG